MISKCAWTYQHQEVQPKLSEAAELGSWTEILSPSLQLPQSSHWVERRGISSILVLPRPPFLKDEVRVQNGSRRGRATTSEGCHVTGHSELVWFLVGVWLGRYIGRKSSGDTSHTEENAGCIVFSLWVLQVLAVAMVYGDFIKRKLRPENWLIVQRQYYQLRPPRIILTPPYTHLSSTPPKFWSSSHICHVSPRKSVTGWKVGPGQCVGAEWLEIRNFPPISITISNRSGHVQRFSRKQLEEGAQTVREHRGKKLQNRVVIL